MGNVSLPVPTERKRPCINSTSIGGVCSSDRGNGSYMESMGHSDKCMMTNGEI